MQTILADDLKKSVKRAGLRYISSDDPGICRQRTDEGFVYFYPDGSRVTETETLERISGLVLPPAWENVWICLEAEGHLQATGTDSRDRKQYRYHADWNKLRSENKFGKLRDFVSVLPRIRAQVEKDLHRQGVSRQKVMAAVLNLMEKAYFRVGSAGYTRQNGSFGLTTLHDSHVKVQGDKLKFAYKGKKGVWQEVELHDRRLARIVKQCREIPGQTLFQYYDEQGERHAIDSGDINAYLKELSGDDFTAKDFRTWAGTLLTFRELLRRPVPASDAEFRSMMAGVTKAVAARLGNTPAVCRQYYMHPALSDACMSGDLLKFYRDHLRLRADYSSEEDFEESLLEKFLVQLAEE